LCSFSHLFGFRRYSVAVLFIFSFAPLFLPSRRFSQCFFATFLAASLHLSHGFFFLKKKQQNPRSWIFGIFPFSSFCFLARLYVTLVSPFAER
jgi:hypothetical protein